MPANVYASGPRLLRGALLGNACFSGFAALLLLLAPSAVASSLGLAAGPLLSGLGVALLLFALSLLVLATRTDPPKRWVVAVIWADAAWVLGSLVLLTSPWAVSLSSQGVVIVFIVAIVVALWGVLQAAGIRAVTGTAGGEQR